MKKRKLKYLLWILALGILLCLVSVFSLCVGSAGIPLKKTIEVLFNGTRGIEYSILFDIRMPRIVLGIAIGGALSLTGVILQGIFRNPLVEPYTLGISGGAGLGVCMGLALRVYEFLGLLSLVILGFLGSIVVIALAYSLNARKGILKIQELLLTGVMISFISSSLIMLIMAVSRTEDLRGIVFWIMGSLEESNRILIKITFLASISLLAVSYLYFIPLNALSLGEEEAVHLGVDIEKTKRFLFVIASLLTGICVSIAGIIGFVGLAVPHFVRMFISRDHRVLLIASFLCGAGFLILCDTIARTIISPLELPVGVITGALGGGIFIYILARKPVLL